MSEFLDINEDDQLHVADLVKKSQNKTRKLFTQKN